MSGDNIVKNTAKVKNNDRCYRDKRDEFIQSVQLRKRQTMHVKLLSAQEKKRLKASVEMMSMILCVLERKNSQIEKINVFIDNNRGKIFPIDCDFCETILSTDYSEKQIEILNLMSNLLHSMKSILSKFWVKKADYINYIAYFTLFIIFPKRF